MSASRRLLRLYLLLALVAVPVSAASHLLQHGIDPPDAVCGLCLVSAQASVPSSAPALAPPPLAPARGPVIPVTAERWFFNLLRARAPPRFSIAA